jgi:protein-disulfide isomerase
MLACAAESRSLGGVEQKCVKVGAVNPVESDEQDLTRKQRREQARSERKAIEQAQLESAVRRTRLTQLGIVVTVVVVAVVVILIASGGGGSKPVASHSKAANENVAGVNALIGGIPQSGNVLGNPSAPVTLKYFGDLECPGCRQFTLGALQPIIQNWVRGGKLKIEYHSLETATREPEVFKTQQVAALAAGKQQKLWYYIELFYHEQGEEGSGYVTEGYLRNLAEQVPGLNISKWTSDRGNSALANEVVRDAQAANNAGFNGTPSFLIGKNGGAMGKLEPSSYTDPASFNDAIEKLLKS